LGESGEGETNERREDRQSHGASIQSEQGEADKVLPILETARANSIRENPRALSF